MSSVDKTIEDLTRQVAILKLAFKEICLEEYGYYSDDILDEYMSIVEDRYEDERSE